MFFFQFNLSFVPLKHQWNMFFFQFNLSFVPLKHQWNIDGLSFGDSFWVFKMTNYRDWIYLFLCFSFNSISITSHKNINETSTTFHSAIVFGSLKWQIIEIEFICSHVFLSIQSLFCPIKTSMKHRWIVIRRFFLGLQNDKL